ncbi:MAG: KEOPS complex subunit Cgi121 [archaeon]|nr:KEOPS complex subunit Cgi121 [archaeon]
MDNIKIIGFKGNITSLDDTLEFINNIKKENPNSVIQLIDASCIGGLRHINHAIYHSYLAFERGENLAKDLSVEIVLRASGQRQISKAFKILGLKEGQIDICAIFIDCNNEIIDSFNDIFIREDSVLTTNSLKLQEVYNISNKEIEYMDIEDILIDKSTKLIVDY